MQNCNVNGLEYETFITDMAMLKEDGSLDVERIKNLPIEEFITEIGSLTESQYAYFCANIPLNEGRGQSTKAVTLDESFDKGVDATEFLRKIRSEISKL